MRISKLITLLLIGLHSSTYTQEEPELSQMPTEQEHIEQTEQQTAENSTPATETTVPAEPATVEEQTAVAPEPATAEAAAQSPATEQPATPSPEASQPAMSTAPSSEPQPIEIPAIPEPTIDEETHVSVEPSTESPVGIDTVSLEDPQGNWLFKRIWWERAEERYEKIRLLVDAIWESRTIFFIKRNELDRNVLDPFYLNIGVSQGE